MRYMNERDRERCSTRSTKRRCRIRGDPTGTHNTRPQEPDKIWKSSHQSAQERCKARMARGGGGGWSEGLQTRQCAFKRGSALRPKHPAARPHMPSTVSCDGSDAGGCRADRPRGPSCGLGGPNGDERKGVVAKKHATGVCLKTRIRIQRSCSFLKRQTSRS